MKLFFFFIFYCHWGCFIDLLFGWLVWFSFFFCLFSIFFYCFDLQNLFLPWVDRSFFVVWKVSMNTSIDQYTMTDEYIHLKSWGFVSILWLTTNLNSYFNTAVKKSSLNVSDLSTFCNATFFFLISYSYFFNIVFIVVFFLFVSSIFYFFWIITCFIQLFLFIF